ncbi:MAG: LLM class flavin-dependent oxidoreductase [Candidatus Methylomirabilia bacterium]
MNQQRYLHVATDAVRAGAAEAGRDPDAIKIAIILHTILTDDLDRSALIGRSMAAGYYDYSPMLFAPPNLTWDGPAVEELKRQVWPDFHHTAHLESSGRLVSFLPDEAVDAFALYGPPEAITDHIREVLNLGFPLEMIIPHPVPPSPPGGPRPDYIDTFATKVIKRLK